MKPLEKAVRKSGLKLQYLAEKCGVSRNTLNKALKTPHLAKFEVIQKLLQEFSHLDYNDIYGHPQNHIYLNRKKGKIIARNGEKEIVVHPNTTIASIIHQLE